MSYETMSQIPTNAEKITGNYRCFDDIANLIIRVQLKEIINENIIDTSETVDVESKNFRWQEKKFGKSEREIYGDLKNCITDLDKKYHVDVKNTLDSDDVLYSYVDEDEFCYEEENVSTSSFTSKLSLQMNALRFVEREAPNSKFDFTKNIVEASNNPFIDNNFETMHVMADFGDYLENTWIKSEYILCTLKYNKNKKVLSIFPDFTVFGPYRLTVEGDLTKNYEYTIENTSDCINQELFEREHEILNKIASHERKLKQLTIGYNFIIPPKNKLHVHLFLEIVKAKNFEFNDIYVQYFLDLPDGWGCFDQSSLKGVTQACHTKDTEGTAYFGLPFEVMLDFDLAKLDKVCVLGAPYIYFEVISKDTFDRFRTEGVTYTKLPIYPGSYNFKLDCLRILPNKLSLNLRRFFIGDYKNYDDITWFGLPKEHEDAVLNKQGVTTVGTGEIEVRVNVVHQSQAFINDVCKNEDRREKFILEKLGSSALVKSVEQVLEAFKRARDNMLDARRKAA